MYKVSSIEEKLYIIEYSLSIILTNCAATTNIQCLHFTADADITDGIEEDTVRPLNSML